jgi:hypothetical protein
MTQPDLAPDRLQRRLEHFMTEIATPATAPAMPGATQPRRRRRAFAVTAIVAAASIATFIGVAVSGGPSGHGAQAFAIENQPSGAVSIQVVNNTVDAADMTRQLREQGFNFTVDTVPVSPQLVGTWLTVSADENANQAAVDQLVGQMKSANPTIVVPSTLATASLWFTFGRAARVGEAPAAVGVGNALAPAGSLYCLRVSGATPAHAAQVLTAAGYRPHFSPVGNPSTTHQSYQQHYRAYTSQAPTTGIVAAAHVNDPLLPFAGPKDVYLFVYSQDDPHLGPNMWLGYPASVQASGIRDYSPCP